MTNRNLIVAMICMVATLALNACIGRTVYSNIHDTNISGWHKDSVITFTIPAPDQTQPYEIELLVRHTENYPYQNMWIFLDKDTIEFYLADDRGLWLGNKKNGLVEMPVLIESNYTFQKDTLTMHVKHGMRDELLKGISNIGIIVKNGKE